MNRVNNKWIAALLALLMWIPAILLGAYKIEQLLVRVVMEERLEKAHLETLILAKDQINWHKRGQEILINNRLFDVKSMQADGNHIILTGIYDDQETSIREKITRLENRQQREKEQHRSLLLRMQSLLNYYEDHSRQWILPVPEITITPYTAYQLRITAPYSAIHIPPPKA